MLMLTTQNVTMTAEDIITGDWRLVGELDVPPHVGSQPAATLDLGTYDTTSAAPTFILNVEPEPTEAPDDAFVANLERLDERDTYRLIYMFNNFGGPTYHVKVWRRWETKSAG